MSTPNFDAIVFDMDGTLFDSSTLVPDAYRATMGLVGGPAISRDEVIQRYHLGPPHNIMNDLLGIDSGPEVIDEAVERYHGQLSAELASLNPYEGIREVVTELGLAMPLGVFTGADTKSALMLLEGAGLLALFSATCGTEPGMPPKPAADGLLLTCAKLGVRPDRVAYIGDGPLVQRCARAAGAFAVAAGWGHLRDDTEPTDLYAETPHELLTLLSEPR
ncbi:MAG: HAD hydrolase-like protein [Thermoleophilia bacterium]|nr:HAD hydrolase-like protein [Thermoleophilia bacterium]